MYLALCIRTTSLHVIFTCSLHIDVHTSRLFASVKLQQLMIFFKWLRQALHYPSYSTLVVRSLQIHRHWTLFLVQKKKILDSKVHRGSSVCMRSWTSLLMKGREKRLEATWTQSFVRGALADLRQWLPIQSTMGEKARVVTRAGTLVVRVCVEAG